ncbi:protein Spindly-like [Camponotus floridanus]|uniref:protein Spindly-like n=1 Tax=Camponotus floridanus TaxID=104421 RepID=UPI00059E47EC|nr:protein Spindly-like [Camponotus floridanus]
MSKLPNLGGESAIDVKVKECLEESLIQDDYKKLKHENECYLQQLHVLRLKLEASEALNKELQERNEALEQSADQHATKINQMFAERKEKYRVEKEEYENYIADLEIKATQNIQEITELREELKRLRNLNQPHDSICTDDVTMYKEENKELAILLKTEKKNVEQLEEKFTNMETQYQELENLLKITTKQLEEKNEALENMREELAINRMELESLKVTPASVTCKGNSLFAEVEDRRQMLLGQMKKLQIKYQEAKQALNIKMKEIHLLRTEKTELIRKWETDVIDAQQEDADLLNKYKSRIFDLESKLKIEIERNNQVEEIQSTDDSFNYAQLLVTKTKKELKELKEKMERQIMQMLIQEEANHHISKQLRYWRSKAISMEVQILAIKTQLETQQINNNHNKNLSEIIENFNVNIANTDFEKSCDNLKITSNNLIPASNICQRNLRASDKSIVDECINNQKEFNKKVI